jgi:hypothetical protein
MTHDINDISYLLWHLVIGIQCTTIKFQFYEIICEHLRLVKHLILVRTLHSLKQNLVRTLQIND